VWTGRASRSVEIGFPVKSGQSEKRCGSSRILCWPRSQEKKNCTSAEDTQTDTFPPLRSSACCSVETVDLSHLFEDLPPRQTNVFPTKFRGLPLAVARQMSVSSTTDSYCRSCCCRWRPCEWPVEKSARNGMLTQLSPSNHARLVPPYDTVSLAAMLFVCSSCTSYSALHIPPAADPEHRCASALCCFH
jgi:hypothetical protein